MYSMLMVNAHLNSGDLKIYSDTYIDVVMV